MKLRTFIGWNLAVMDDLLILLKGLIPEFSQTVLMSIGAVIGGWLGYVLGGLDLAILWLFGFTILDYITGNLAVLKQGKWRSKLAYKGAFKKLFIFIMVAICHGVDESLNTDFVRTACIFAYIINEVGSILENVDKMGYGDVIPPVLRNALQAIKAREDAKGNIIPTKELSKEPNKEEKK